MEHEIDWYQLANRLGLLQENGESGGSESALRAIEMLIGEEAMRQTVEYYISRKQGSELARHFLWLLHPWSAMEYCYKLYKTETNIARKHSAIALLKVVADRRSVIWIPEFIMDTDQTINYLGVGIIEQLTWSGLIDFEESINLINLAEQYSNESTIDLIEYVKTTVSRRQREDELWNKIRKGNGVDNDCN